MGVRRSSVEDLVITGFGDSFFGKRVLVTGHTGFKGGWLCLWLHRLGAIVHGYALDPLAEPNLFHAARVQSVLTSDTRADLADLAQLMSTIDKAQPEIIFHLAAQPLVRKSYGDPLGTLATNIMGTAHVLEASRRSDSLRALVVITTDKVYRRLEWPYAFREIDALGGDDPYSASKSAAEIITASYRVSFFSGPSGHPAHVATARAGNVIGGGDWAPDRLMPDCLNAFASDEPVRLRFPHSVRPWQHVLEPLAGYLKLAELLQGADGARYAKAWNFGPSADNDATVGDVAKSVARLWSDEARMEYAPDAENHNETSVLRLDNALARTELGWLPLWSLPRALEETVAWHRALASGANMQAVSLSQIDNYCSTARQ